MKEKLNFNLKLILPAAGFGRRVGRPPAKELLRHPHAQTPLIAYAIERHQELLAPFLVISRQSKQVLNEYLADFKKSRGNIQLELCQIDSSREWPETILKSQELWADWNLVLLPDTEYSPLLNITKVNELLQRASELNAQMIFGTFSVQDPRNWGCVQIENKKVRIVEKPLLVKEQDSVGDERSLKSFEFKQAWGLIFFKKEIGVQLFSKLLESTQDHLWKSLDKCGMCFELVEFKDLTRWEE